MIKTTRFRPIAPRPQEGANASKDKPSSAAPAKSTSNLKVETKKVETLTKVPAPKTEVPIQPGDISLDPKNFCYPELRPATSDFDTSSGMSSAYFGGYNSYYGGYSGASHPRMQYVGNSCHLGGGPCGSQACCNGGVGGGRLGRPGPMPYDGQSFNSAGGYGGGPLNSMVQLPRKDHLLNNNDTTTNANNAPTNANTNNNNLSMKLDLDEDSVAKAFGDEYESSKERTRESDGSVDAHESSEPTSRAAEQPKANNTNDLSHKEEELLKKENVGGNASDAENTVQTQAVDCRLAASGSVVRNLSHKGFVNCIAKGSTNPLFHIEKRLACSFISEFLENESIMENFKDKQKIKDALQELDSFTSEEMDFKQQPLKKQKV